MLKKSAILMGLLILLFLPLVLAGNYGTLKYNAGVYGVGEVPVTPVSPTPTSPSSGGSSCTYDWQCTAWFPSICPESEIQERVCANKGTCTGTIGMPNQTQTCEYTGPAEPLFDIYMTLSDDYKEICAGNKIKANIKLENYAKVELLDAFMTYWIVDENNTLIAELKDTRAVEKETNFNIELKIPKSTPEGTYRLYAEITYSGDKTAVTGESFEIISYEDCVLLFPKNIYSKYFIYGGSGIIIILFILILIKILKARFKMQKKGKFRPRNHIKYKNKIKQNLKKIRGKTYLMILFGLILAGILFIAGNNITGFVIETGELIKISSRITYLVLIIGCLGILSFVYRKKIKKIIKTKKRNKHNPNSLNNLIKKRVYTEDGSYIGKVEEIILTKNKIHSLKIKFSKKLKLRKKLKNKGMLIQHKEVKSIGHIVIVDEGVEKYLEDLDRHSNKNYKNQKSLEKL